MRRQTEKKYRQLAEVRGKQQDAKRKEGYRTNKLMAEIFNKVNLAFSQVKITLFLQDVP